MAGASSACAAVGTGSVGVSRRRPTGRGRPAAALRQQCCHTALQRLGRRGPDVLPAVSSVDGKHEGRVNRGRRHGSPPPPAAASVCEAESVELTVGDKAGRAAESVLSDSGQGNGSLLDSSTQLPSRPGFSTIPAALEAVARGESVVVLDDEDRENEGDLILAADRATPEALAFMVRYTSGVVCVGMRGADLDRLEIPLMIEDKANEDAMKTAFTVTVDAKVGTTTGISAADRSATINALASPDSVSTDFNKPGHIFPLRARNGGVLTRPGHTEAAVDLARLSGCFPAGVLCELVNDDGSMSRTPELLQFGHKHRLHVITIKDLVHYIRTQELITWEEKGGLHDSS